MEKKMLRFFLDGSPSCSIGVNHCWRIFNQYAISSEGKHKKNDFFSFFGSIIFFLDLFRIHQNPLKQKKN